MAIAYHKNGPQCKGVERGKLSARRLQTNAATTPIPKMDFTLDAARRGFSIFLLEASTNVPLTPTWREVATRDPDQIRECWALCPDANVGISVKDLLTLRVTELCPPETVAQLALLFQEHDAPKSVVTRRTTAGDGVEICLHFSLPAGGVVAAKRDVFVRGIDVVSNVDFIVGPGSVLDGYDCKFADAKSLSWRPLGYWRFAACSYRKVKQ